MGRPAAFAVAWGFPGSLRSTKRFMSSVRAAIVRRENDCAFRAVRNLVNATSSCEHAAESVSRRDAAGPAIGGAGSVRELDSCAVAKLVATRPTSVKRVRRPVRISILGYCKYLRKRGRNLRTRYPLLQPRRFGLCSEVRLHVRQKTNNR